MFKHLLVIVILRLIIHRQKKNVQTLVSNSNTSTNNSPSKEECSNTCSNSNTSTNNSPSKEECSNTCSNSNTSTNNSPSKEECSNTCSNSNTSTNNSPSKEECSNTCSNSNTSTNNSPSKEECSNTCSNSNTSTNNSPSKEECSNTCSNSNTSTNNSPSKEECSNTCSNSNTSTNNSPSKEELKEKLIEHKKKIRVLQQKVRRKERRISDINNLLQDLKSKELLKGSQCDNLRSSFYGLSADVIINHFNNQLREAKGCRHNDEVKKFTLTLNFYSPRAYEYDQFSAFLMQDPYLTGPLQ